MSKPRVPNTSSDVKVNLHDRPGPEHKTYPNLATGLADLNTRLCYVHNANSVVKLFDFRMMNPAEFKNGSYVNWRYEYVYTPPAPNGGQGKPEVRREKIAAKWFEHESRLERDRMDYVPGKGTWEVAGVLNRWRGFASKPVEGDIKPWNKLLNFLFEGSPAERIYFERWIACPIQRPGTKLKTAIVMHSRRGGVGKNILFEAVENIYGQNAIEINDRDLDDNFNSWCRDKQLIVGDEISGGGTNKHKVANRLKLLITSPYVSVNEKYEKAYQISNAANFVFLSNDEDPIYIPADADNDRRFFVHEVTQDTPLPQEFYAEFKAWKDSPEGIAALHHHFTILELGDFKPDAAAPMTRAKLAMSDVNKSDLERFVFDLKAGSKIPALYTLRDLKDAYATEHDGETVEDKVMLKALGGARVQQANDGGQVRLGKKLVTLWVMAADNDSPDARQLRERTDAPRVLAALYKAQADERRRGDVSGMRPEDDDDLSGSQGTVRAPENKPDKVKVN